MREKEEIKTEEMNGYVHKTLKERIEEYGGILEFIEEIDFGMPEEGEIW